MSVNPEKLNEYLVASNELLARQAAEVEQLSKQAEAGDRDRQAWLKFAEEAAKALVDNKYTTPESQAQVKKALATPDRCSAILKELVEHNFSLRQKLAAAAPVQAEAAKKSAAALARAVDFDVESDNGRSATSAESVMAEMAARIRAQGR